MQPVWVFALRSDGKGPLLALARYAEKMIEPAGPCPTLEKCPEQVMKLGFDFTQSYHVTTVLPTVAVKPR